MSVGALVYLHNRLFMPVVGNSVRPDIAEDIRTVRVGSPFRYRGMSRSCIPGLIKFVRVTCKVETTVGFAEHRLVTLATATFTVPVDEVSILIQDAHI